MNMIRAGLIFLIAIAASVTGADAAPAKMPITVYKARKIITMEPAFPEAKFVAVRAGRVLGLGGSLDDLSAWLDGADYTVDARFSEKIIMPGFIDPHVHPMMAILLPMAFITPEGWELPSGASPPARTAEEYQARLTAVLSLRAHEEVFFTWGYHQLWHGEMTRALLDEIVPDRPVVVWHRSFHEIILNTAALNHLGLNDADEVSKAIAAAHADPEHVNLENGHFFETGLSVAIPALRPYILSPERLALGFGHLKLMMRQNGVTTIADMATGLFAGFASEKAIIEGAFGVAANNPARVLLVPDATTLIRETGSIDAAVKSIAAGGKAEADQRVFVHNRVKLFADGAFFSQYMKMGAPGYSDGHHGKWITPPETFAEQAKAFWDAGITIHWHVNGDQGVDEVLDVVEALQLENPQTDHRLTLEHFGYSRTDQIDRLSKLGVQISAQPNYVFVLGDAYAARGLGFDRASQMVRLGSLEKAGVKTALHSDLTMAPVDPLFLAWVATNRKTMGGTQMAVSERMSLDAALRAITIDAAYILGMEREIGSIAPGKKADFVVLDKNPYRVGRSGLNDIKIHGIIFEGEFSQLLEDAVQIDHR